MIGSEYSFENVGLHSGVNGWIEAILNRAYWLVDLGRAEIQFAFARSSP
jgi:hypothetical protein